MAWALEEAGYIARLQAWDFRPGSNFVVQMHEAAQLAKQTIAVLSPNYIGSEFAEAEWAAAFAEDPVGHERALISVRVAPTKVDGLMSQIVWIDLVGLDQPTAKARLLAGVRPGRAKPVAEPAFPGTTNIGNSHSIQESQRFITPLAWQPLAEQPTISWRRDFLGQCAQNMATLVELHMIPVPPLLVEVRRLGRMGEELAVIGRNAGLFSATQALAVEANDRYAYVMAQPQRHQDEIGLAVTRVAQRSVWLTLPHDSMGSVFDRDDLRPRLAALIKLLRSIPLPEAEQIAFALHVEPLSLLSTGSASAIGHRSSTTMPFASRNFCSIEPEDTVSPQALDANADDVADELTERLAAALRP
jgi:hypothetical protein